MRAAMKNDNDSQRIQGSEQDGHARVKTLSKVTASSSRKAHPVDKGWAWAIVVGVFGIHFFSFGYIRSFGILFLEFQRKYEASSAETAVVSGVLYCSYSLMTLLVVNVILKRFSVRQCCLTGSVIQGLAIALNGIVPNINYLIVTQGILFGCGYALLYCPAMIIVSQYFNQKRAIATVVASCGVSAGGMTLPLLIRYLIDYYGLRGGLLLLAATMIHQAVFAALFTPTNKYKIISVEERYLDDVDEHFGAGPRRNVQTSSLDIHGFESTENNAGSNKGNIISKARESPPKYDIPLTQDDESSHSLEQHLSNADASRQPYPSSRPTIVSSGSKGNKPQFTDNVSDDIDETDPPMTSTFSSQLSSGQQNEILHPEPNLRSRSDLRKKSEKISDAEMCLLEERSMTGDCSGSPQDSSRKPSLKTTVLNALSASSMDLHGSLNSFIHLDPSVPNESAAKRSTSYKDNGEQHNRRKRLGCRVPTMMKTVAFWALLVFFGCGGIASALPPVFMPPLATEKDIRSMSTIMLIVSAVTEMFGRLIPGFILHVGFMRASSVLVFPMAACATVYQFTALYNDFSTLLTMAILSGLFTGTFWATQSLVVIEVFGLDSLGPMLGFYFLVLGLSVGAAHPIAGLLRDVSGTYVTTFHFFGAMYFMATLMMLLIMFIKRDNDKNHGNASRNKPPSIK